MSIESVQHQAEDLVRSVVAHYKDKDWGAEGAGVGIAARLGEPDGNYVVIVKRPGPEHPWAK
jgi:hypothetical protein